VFVPSTHHRFAQWFACPTAAVTASFFAVTFFIALLGAVFLPREARQLADSQHVSVTHSVVPAAGGLGASLFWSISENGRIGWRHHLAIHDLNQHRQPLEFPCTRLNPLSLAPGPDADHVLVGNWDGGIYSLDLQHPAAEPVCIGKQDGGGVVSLAYSAAGRCVISQDALVVYAWDLVSHRERWRRDHSASYCLAIRPNAPVAILGNMDGSLSEVDLRDGRDLRLLAHYESPVLSAAVSPDGTRLALLRGDDRLLLLDSRSLQPLWPDDGRQLEIRNTASRLTVFSPCGRYLITSGRDGGRAVLVWSVQSGDFLRELRGHENVVLGAAFAADGTLRSWGADGTIRVWDLHTGAARQVAVLAMPAPSG
jgi:WD40 repeat protein